MFGSIFGRSATGKIIREAGEDKRRQSAEARRAYNELNELSQARIVGNYPDPFQQQILAMQQRLEVVEHANHILKLRVKELEEVDSSDKEKERLKGHNKKLVERINALENRGKSGRES